MSGLAWRASATSLGSKSLTDCGRNCSASGSFFVCRESWCWPGARFGRLTTCDWTQVIFLSISHRYEMEDNQKTYRCWLGISQWCCCWSLRLSQQKMSWKCEASATWGILVSWATSLGPNLWIAGASDSSRVLGPRVFSFCEDNGACVNGYIRLISKKHSHFLVWRSPLPN